MLQVHSGAVRQLHWSRRGWRQRDRSIGAALNAVCSVCDAPRARNSPPLGRPAVISASVAPFPTPKAQRPAVYVRPESTTTRLEGPTATCVTKEQSRYKLNERRVQRAPHCVSHQPLPGQTECNKCTEGRFNPIEGQRACSACGLGTCALYWRE